VAEVVRGGYLTNISPSEFAERVEPRLPSHISGAEFLSRCACGWGAASST
jgi:hypothetical protein